MGKGNSVMIHVVILGGLLMKTIDTAGLIRYYNVINPKRTALGQ